jgi:molecular chaperone HtpG
MAEERVNIKHGTIRTDFHGLIELLAKNLYPQEDMFIRELVQNAHDAIVKRHAFEAAPAGRIDITAEREARTVVFRDNGAGLTEAEITDYLATIGRSGTGELRQQLEQRDRDRAQSLIGQFGIGILSAFVAAERLEVETFSVSDDQSGLRWSVSGGPQYELALIPRQEAGTLVTLRIKPAFLRMTNPDTLREAVRRYADFLPFPLYINGEGPVNTMQAPWHRAYSSERERKTAYQRWVNDRFPDRPLEVMPVQLETPYPVQGVLYISDRQLPDSDMAGMVDIYQARMFIRQGDRTMLPLWAKFVRGVIDSVALTPTAARDAVQQDAVHDAIRDALGRLIINALKSLATEDKPRFRRLMEWHHYHIKGMAVEFDEFFDAIADMVIFEVNRPDPRGGLHAFQQLTLPEYLALQSKADDKGRKLIYYISEGGAAPQFYRLSQAKGLHALNAGMIFEERFLRKYVDKQPQTLALQRVDIAEGTAIFEPLADAERVAFVDLEYRLGVLLRTHMPQQETRVVTERFAPSDIPAVLTHTRDAETARRLEELAVHPSLSSSLSDAMREIFGIQQQRMQPVVLHLNITSPFIERLCQEDFGDPIVQDTWMAVYNNAAMYSQQFLSTHNLEVLHTQTLKLMNNVLTLRETQRQLGSRVAELEASSEPQPPEDVRPAQRTQHVSLFVMMPFGPKYDALEAALRQVFEDDPYNFQVILARDRTIRPNLFENVKAHMQMVHGFVADVSDLNPNVMLELGITEVDAGRRPVVILRRQDSAEIPADLRGLLYVEYELPAASEPDHIGHLVALLREKLRTIQAVDELRHHRTARYLSATYVKKHLSRIQLTAAELDTLCRAFPTIEALEAADQAEIKGRTGFDAIVVGALATAFRRL